MKVNSFVCVDARGEHSNLTYGKLYNKIDEEMSLIKIVNDKGKKRSYFINRFKPLQDARDEKLKSLGI